MDMIRFATDNDFNFVKKSWQTCFDDPQEFVDWNFKCNYSPKNTVIAEAGGEPASAAQLMPYQMVIGDKVLPVRYVSGVATMPEYRGRGLVRSMFDFALPKMHSMGCLISILVPAVDGMYEKFGYRKICDRASYFTEVLPDTERIEEYSPDIIGIVDAIYRKEMSSKSVYIKRGKEEWEKILTDLLSLSRGKVLLFERGYALAYPKDNGYQVAELCGEAKLDCTVQKEPPVMARITNLKGLRELFPTIFEGLGSVRTEDKIIAENNMEINFGKDNKRLDIAETTEYFFKTLQKDGGAYINLLL